MFRRDNISYEMMPSEQSLELNGHVANRLFNHINNRNAISMFITNGVFMI